MLALYTAGIIASGRPPPWTMQRTPRPYSSYESQGSPPSRLPHRCAASGAACPVRGGRRPSGGSITSDVRRDVVLYSRQCGIGAVAPWTRPDSTSTGARYALSVRSVAMLLEWYLL